MSLLFSLFLVFERWFCTRKVFQEEDQQGKTFILVGRSAHQDVIQLEGLAFFGTPLLAGRTCGS